MEFKDLLAKFRAKSKDERTKGTKFELFCVKFLREYELYKKEFEKVDMWDNWGFGESDSGIDIVAKTHNGEYVAIQCKCYDENTKLDLKQLSTFFITKDRTFNLQGTPIQFTQYMLMDTADDITAKVTKFINDTDISFTRLDYNSIAQANINWAIFDEKGEIEFYDKKQLRNHQKEAIEAIKKEFEINDRTKLIMACGTGKSLTGIRLFDNMIDNGQIGVFFAPSIALVAQTLKESFEQSEKSFRAFVVCSDKKVGSQNSDDEDMKAYELPIPPTTDENNLAKYIKQDLDKNERVIIFSTYQSIDVIIKAQKLLNKEFSLVICDEAHRTAGVKITKDGISQESAFQKVHSDDNIKATKRLYMSATPKIFSQNAKSKADKDNEVELYSMDDEDIFGREAYNLKFDKALALGLLSEYKVLITIINQEQVAEVTNTLSKAKKDGYVNLNIDGKETPVDIELIGKILATYKSLLKNDVYTIDTTGNKEALEEDTSKIMKRAIAFNNSIAVSKTRQSVFSPTIKLYNDLVKKDNQKVHIDHIDGTMNQSIKNTKLSWLKENSDEIRILSNARCLTEGVDVPALDAVIFFDARDSMVDIVQAVGRVMRKAQNKQYGYIILPIMLDIKNEKDFDQILDSKDFKGVWKILKAIRSHDESLVSEVEFTKKIKINAVGDKLTNKETTNGTKGGGEIEPTSSDIKRDGGSYTQEDLFTAQRLEELAKTMYAIIPNKLGDREYWGSFAKNIAKIVPILELRIKELLNSDEKVKKEIEKFLKALRDNINSSITEQDAITMLIQHIITRPIFEAIFPNGEFKLKNIVSKSMERVYDKLERHSLSDETKSLSSLYKSIGDNANYAKSDKEKQEIIKNLYDNFFNNAFKKESEKLGIVYTPIEVVDFIIHSVNYALKKHFGKELKDKKVNILDGFTGTGTFIVRLIQSGLLDENLIHKYKNELHANEITLLAYYIANLNISAAYHQALGKSDAHNYLMPPKLLLTDTFEMEETKEFLPALEDEILGENKENRRTQRNTPIDVIIGNPPYSVGQKSGNDDNKNTKYPALFKKIAESYAKESTATNKNSLYDTYKLAIRWASDRIEHNGIIGYVTNGSFIDGNSDDGLRACLEKEFSYIYIINLRGNQRTQGEESRKEGGKIFGGGSRTPVAITLLIKDENYKGQKAEINYFDIGDYLSREQKLNKINYYHDISKVDFTRIIPNKFNDWIDQRDESFNKFVLIGSKDKGNKEQTIFESVYSRGLEGARDIWIYNFDKKTLAENMDSTINIYNQECEKYAGNKNYSKLINRNSKEISWCSSLEPKVFKGIKAVFDKNKIRKAIYRPYCEEYLYYDEMFNHRQGQMPFIFPTNKHHNLIIAINGIGGADFYSLISNKIVDLGILSASQCFPLYYYEKVEDNKLNLNDSNAVIIDGYERKDAIRDWALAEFQKVYNDRNITKEDIFYYIYGLFHSKEYISKYKNNLSKMLPRIPYCIDFWGFSRIGKELANIHLNYENIDIKLSKAKLITKTQNSLFDQAEQLSDNDFKVDKMRFEKNVKITDKPSKIIYNNKIVIANIDEKAYDYIVNGKSAIAWVMERYQVKTDEDSGITNDPNLYSDDPRYIVDLMMKVIEVSLRSVELIEKLPALDILER
ncbi:type ISP restriction/modification enzyme [Campylobacter devanensis]|uniref:type ISP restriction/modification enzyme n=1 Tax=Campylobacter devanensis TaxID=3161138 RepID=UPI000A349429|nr:type ISP restriction/modification enzyme [Campylobacter sp. P0023]